MIAVLTVLILQTAYAQAGSAEEYEAPVVRPFEPNGSIDAAQPPVRGAAPDRSVTVDSYQRSYEAPQSEGEAAYQAGVTQAEISADALSGPMDGAWLVRDGAGRVLLRLVLNDRGGGRPVEGAWMADPASRARGSGLVAPAAQDGATTLTLEGEGRLILSAPGAGVLERDGRREPVTLVRPS